MNVTYDVLIKDARRFVTFWSGNHDVVGRYLNVFITFRLLPNVTLLSDRNVFVFYHENVTKDVSITF